MRTATQRGPLHVVAPPKSGPTPSPARRTVALTVEEVYALPAAVDLVTAGRAFGVGRTKAHELARLGKFPVPVLTLGRSYRCMKADILRKLGLEVPLPSASNQ